MADEPMFVIPTYRLRDVAETVRAYDEHFRRNGSAVTMIVFDDSSTTNQQRYFPLLQAVHTTNPLYYVGPREKEEFLQTLLARLRDRKLESLVRNLFRPSYGGNRNYTLMYTLGQLMITADDDMRPTALVEASPESLNDGEVCRGRLVRAGADCCTQKSFDIVAAFRDVLGKRVADAPANHERGELIIDSSMDLETNATKGGLSRENTLTLLPGTVDRTAIVKMAQTYRSGTADFDAIDFAEMFLDNDEQLDADALNDQYVLVNWRPAITNINWRMDCGVAAYDNRLGLPPFFPTRLRFEDYIHRLWIQQPNIVAAHVDAAQHHIKSNYMRSPLASELFNEEVANLLKNKIRTSLTKLDELSIEFAYEGEVTLADADAILERATSLHQRVTQAAASAQGERRTALQQFATAVERSFYTFEPDFFQQNLLRIVDDVVSQFKGCLELWPTLVEITYLRSRRTPLPMVHIGGRSAAAA